MKTTEEIRARIKEIISNVANIPVDQISDQAHYRDDLNLDSLSLLEIGVDVDYEYKLGLPEEKLQEIHSLQDAVELVAAQLEAKATASQVA